MLKFIKRYQPRVSGVFNRTEEGGTSLDLKELASQLISNYGTIGLYLYFVVDTMGVFLPSKSILTLIGVLVDKGVFGFTPVVLTAVSGSLTGVSISYLIGKNIGKPAAEKYGRYIRVTPEKLLQAEKWFTRYGAAVIVFAYFVPVLRHITPYLSGITRLPYWKVILFSAVGASLWVITFVSLGRFLGGNLDKILDTIPPSALLVGILSVTVLYFIKRKISAG